MGRLSRRPCVDDGPSRDAPLQGFGKRRRGKCIVSAHTTHTATSVLKPLRALWANYPMNAVTKCFRL
ncbi:hypothetical protein OKW36_007783 [Paraburkholderia sp. MM5482-R1]